MLTKLKLALMIAAPLTAGAASYALADGGVVGNGRAGALQKFDKNGDGTLDDAERADLKAAWKEKRAERHQAMLAQFDANRDGTLDPVERAAMRDAMLTQRFQAMDANGDGALSIDEFKAAAAKPGAHHHGRHGHGRHHKGLGQGIKG